MGTKIGNIQHITDFADGSQLIRIETDIPRNEGTDSAFDTFVSTTLPKLLNSTLTTQEASDAAAFLVERIGSADERKTARNLARAIFNQSFGS